jgi:hypothetical protein
MNWITLNLSAVIQTIGMIAAACAAYFGLKNHALSTQIHVDTNSRLTTLLSENTALTAEVTALKAAILAMTKESKAAVIVASTKATADVAAASLAGRPT